MTKIKFLASTVLIATALSACTIVSMNHAADAVKRPDPSVTFTHDYAFEDFKITKVKKEGFLGEKMEGRGEGIYLTKSLLKKIPDAPEQLAVGDEIEVAWKKSDYLKEDWNKIHGIEFIN